MTPGKGNWEAPDAKAKGEICDDWQFAFDDRACFDSETGELLELNK